MSLYFESTLYFICNGENIFVSSQFEQRTLFVPLWTIKQKEGKSSKAEQRERQALDRDEVMGQNLSPSLSRGLVQGWRKLQGVAMLDLL